MIVTTWLLFTCGLRWAAGAMTKRSKFVWWGGQPFRKVAKDDEVSSVRDCRSDDSERCVCQRKAIDRRDAQQSRQGECDVRPQGQYLCLPGVRLVHADERLHHHRRQ